MRYRPQFAYHEPAGEQERDFIHYFDQTTTPQLSNALGLAAGDTIIGIPLPLQSDAPFNWRAVRINGPANYAVRFRDPYGNYLDDDWVPLPLEPAVRQTGGYGSNPRALEPEIRCPAGSQVLVDIKRLS